MLIHSLFSLELVGKSELGSLLLQLGELVLVLGDLLELRLILSKLLSSDSTKLSILSNLVGRPCTDRLTIDIDIGLLPHIEPDNLSILGVDGPSDLLQTAAAPSLRVA